MHIAIVGCGYWGPNLIRNFQYIDGVKVSICDIRQECLQAALKRFTVEKATTDLSNILEDSNIDAIVIATPAKTHFALARKALSAGKHVLVEKPIALSSKDAQKLIDLAKKKNKILMVGHTFEYNPAVVKLKEYISSGKLGKIYYAYCSRLNLGQIREDINAIWNLAPHDISIVLYLFNKMPLTVMVIGKAFIQKDIEDVVFINLGFPDNVMAHIHVSWLDPSKMRCVTVVGDKKMIIYNDMDNETRLKIYDKGFSRMIPNDTYGEYFYKLRSGDIYMPKIDMTEPLKIECNHFIDSIKRNKKPKTDGENGLRVVKVLEAAQSSLENKGRLVKL